MQDTEEDSEDEVKAETTDALDSEDEEVEDSNEEVEAEAAETLDSEDEEVEDSDDEEELGSTFGTNADSFTEVPESAQHYA